MQRFESTIGVFDDRLSPVAGNQSSHGPRDFTAEKGREREDSTTSGFQSDMADREFDSLVHQIFAGDNGRCVAFCGADSTANSLVVVRRTASVLAEQVSGRVCIATVADQDEGSQPDGSRPKNLFERTLYNESAGTAGSHKIDTLQKDIQELRKDFDYILIGLPAINRGSDLAICAPLVDGIVLVLEANHTRKITARRAHERIAASRGKLLGIVLNNRTYPIPEKIYHRL
ncbi:MAG: hypothetical protein WB679_04850 [Terracidiphilus sp.]